MNTPVMQGAVYAGSGQSVQGSFKVKSFSQLAVAAAANTSGAIDSDIVLLVATDYYRLEIDGTADASSMIMPPGMIPLCITKGSTLSVIRLGADDSEISIIIPE